MGKNKKKRNRDSEDSGSGLTPPSKTTVNMAASQQQQQTFSQLLNQAHESYLSPHASFNGSPNQFQSNNTTYPVNPAPNVMHPQIFQPQHIPVCHSTPAPVSSPPFVTQCNIQPPFPIPSESTNILQTLCSNIDMMNRRFDGIESFMKEKLSKLDLIDKLGEKFDKFEKQLIGMRNEIDEIRDIQKNQDEILEKEEGHHHEVADRMAKLENINYDLENENCELRENFLELKTHSMKYNLIFSGIQQTDHENENTEAVLKHFIHTELDVGNVGDIEFHNVHRLRNRTDGKPRSIIAKFAKYSDHERVRKSAYKLKEKPNFIISQQYPAEIAERRKRLFPKLKEFQRMGKRATIVYDKLIVDGRHYEPTARNEPPPIHTRDRHSNR